MQQSSTLTYRTYIHREFAIRKRRNPAYSLRAFARDLNVPAPKLSQVLRVVRGISTSRAIQMAKRLNLSDSESELFISLVDSEHGRSREARKQAQDAVARLSAAQNFDALSLERFKVISDWYHFAILELSEVKGFKSEPKWIAKKLGISLDQSQKAIQRLLEFGLLQKVSGQLRQTQADLATPSGIPSRELREHHSQILEKAEEALETVPVQQRDFSAVTMAIASDQMEEASTWLREFRRKFCKDIQANPNKDRVYCLSIQFFPLDSIETERESKP
jgi:uncharacterized protein (TIGR02147 family)